jgi:LmbE family N-acetylglucosaminyl deacetylase
LDSVGWPTTGFLFKVSICRINAELTTARFACSITGMFHAASRLIWPFSSVQKVLLLVLSFCGVCTLSVFAQPTSGGPKQGSDLLKTEIMGVFAHPDDETGVAATLAFYALGKTSIVANVYCTRGEGGGNMVGTQSGAALGALREAELRDCLSILGVRYCYFLDQLDWAYTESLAATLDKWGKERTLERLVRIVRALRPEVMVTMNPAPTPGQHGHHQAAAVLATEAFTAAADPKRFPDQLTKEGLTAWQPRKLFYGGASGELVATIAVNEPLPNGKTPAQVAGQAMINHRSQAFGNAGNSAWFQRPQKFTLVKAFVPVSPGQSDLMQGLPTTEASALPVAFTAERPNKPLDIEFIPRPAVGQYRKWVKEQGIEHVAIQFQTDLPLVMGETNAVRLHLANREAALVEGELAIVAPAEWLVEPARQRIRVPSGAGSEIELRVVPPLDARADAELTASFATSGASFEAKANAHPLPESRAASTHNCPRSGRHGCRLGKDSVACHLPTNLVEGKVVDEADSSAVFRIAHDGTSLFIDVQVKDDAVISNIAPNDIRGHWRSDSVEICVDPVGGAEHTMGCYKLGIFPFDMTGVVRAARDADARQGPVEETAPNTRLTSRRTTDGYRIQAAIPFAELNLSPGKRRFGFNLIIYDGDKRNAGPGENINKSRIAWAPRSGVQGRPEDWGRIDLE